MISIFKLHENMRGLGDHGTAIKPKTKPDHVYLYHMSVSEQFIRNKTITHTHTRTTLPFSIRTLSNSIGTYLPTLYDSTFHSQKRVLRKKEKSLEVSNSLTTKYIEVRLHQSINHLVSQSVTLRTHSPYLTLPYLTFKFKIKSVENSFQ